MNAIRTSVILVKIAILVSLLSIAGEVFLNGDNKSPADMDIGSQYSDANTSSDLRDRWIQNGW